MRDKVKPISEVKLLSKKVTSSEWLWFDYLKVVGLKVGPKKDSARARHNPIFRLPLERQRGRDSAHLQEYLIEFVMGFALAS